MQRQDSLASVGFDSDQFFARPRKVKTLLAVGISALTVLGLGTGAAIAMENWLAPITCGPVTPRFDTSYFINILNQSQQVFYSENQRFARSIDELPLGMTKDDSLQYSVRATPRAVFNHGVAQNPNAKSYVGAVFIVGANPSKNTKTAAKPTTISGICVAKTAGTQKLAEPTLHNGAIQCGANTEALDYSVKR